jgi:hypothetical protein
MNFLLKFWKALNVTEKQTFINGLSHIGDYGSWGENEPLALLYRMLNEHLQQDFLRIVSNKDYRYYGMEMLDLATNPWYTSSAGKVIDTYKGFEIREVETGIYYCEGVERTTGIHWYAMSTERGIVTGKHGRPNKEKNGFLDLSRELCRGWTSYGNGDNVRKLNFGNLYTLIDIIEDLDIRMDVTAKKCIAKLERENDKIQKDIEPLQKVVDEGHEKISRNKERIQVLGVIDKCPDPSETLLRLNSDDLIGGSNE